MAIVRTGGIASLNPRLIAAIPPGCQKTKATVHGRASNSARCGPSLSYSVRGINVVTLSACHLVTVFVGTVSEPLPQEGFQIGWAQD